jgi:hypothetical protein
VADILARVNGGAARGKQAVSATALCYNPSMKIQIDIATKDRGLTGYLMGNPHTLSAGHTKLSIPGDADLVWEGEELAKAVPDLPRVVHFAVEFGSSVASGVVASWIWGKLKEKPVDHIMIDRTSVEFEEGQLKRILQEKIEEVRGGNLRD